MLPERVGVVQIAFSTMLVIAVPVAAFHLVSGRPAQAAMAAGAAMAGTVLSAQWLRTARR